MNADVTSAHKLTAASLVYYQHQRVLLNSFVPALLEPMMMGWMLSASPAAIFITVARLVMQHSVWAVLAQPINSQVACCQLVNAQNKVIMMLSMFLKSAKNVLPPTVWRVQIPSNVLLAKFRKTRPTHVLCLAATALLAMWTAKSETLV